MSTPDKNFMSVAAEDDFGIMRVGTLVPPDATYADTLKVSGSRWGVIKSDLIVGGYEDCVDINNKSQAIAIICELFQPRGKYVATVKGGSSEILLEGTIDGHGSEVDIDLGNQSDQSSDVTTDVTLSLHTKDGSPIRVRVWNAETPTIVNDHLQQYVFVFPSKLPLLVRRSLWYGYRLLKKVRLVS